MTAAIIAIGDEIVLGQKVDTNSAWLAARLLEVAHPVLEHRTVGDDRRRLAGAIADLAARADVLVLTGGLGPTQDDVTRFALGDVLAPGRPLVRDERVVAALRRRFARRDVEMPASNLGQADHPDTMRLLPNPHGTAPGLAGRHGDCHVFSLPGPPREMKPMFEAQVLPALPAAATDHCVLTETVHAFGLGESWAAERLGPLMDRDREDLMVGTTASGGVITARVRAAGTRAAATAALADTVARVEALWAPFVFGRGERGLADAVVEALRSTGRRLVTAESCTGGWIGKLVVDVPGASDVYAGGFVTYANALKTSCLGVPADLIERAGAVSPEVADAMARGALAATDATCSLSVTGVAGPGGTAARPAGLVYVGLGWREGTAVTTSVRCLRVPGDRTNVRDRSSKSALQMLRLRLLGADARLLWEDAVP